MGLSVAEKIELIELLEIKASRKLAEKLKDSFYEFFLHFWDCIATNELVANWHIKAICDELQPHVERAMRLEKKEGDIIINICPGTTKSSIVSQVLCAWCWAKHPETIMISSTGSSQLTNKNSLKTRDIILSNKYQELFPHVVLRKDASAKTFYQNTEGGVRYSFTTKGDPIGNHAHIIIQDDPESQSEAKSKVQMERSNEGMKALSTRMIDKTTTLRILLMQRLSPIDSTTFAMKTFDNPIHICLPARLSDLVKPDKFREMYIDGLLDPVRLSEEVLVTEKKKLNTESGDGTSELDFPAQFLQDPKSAEGLIYNLQYYDKIPNEVSAISLGAADLADAGTDYLAAPFGKVVGKTVYIHDAVYTQESSDTAAERLAQKTVLYDVQRLVAEKNNMGDTYITLLKRLGAQNVKGVTSKGNKMNRIVSHAWIVNEHFRFSKTGSKEYMKFLRRLESILKTDTKEDDAADAISLMCNYLYVNYKHIFR